MADRTGELQRHAAERRGFGYLSVDARRSGLPCRATSCRRIFAVPHGDDLAELRSAIATRNAHELDDHQLIYFVAAPAAPRGKRRGWSKR